MQGYWWEMFVVVLCLKASFSFLKDAFISGRLLCWHFFSSRILNMSSYYFLSSISSIVKSVISLIFVSLKLYVFFVSFGLLWMSLSNIAFELFYSNVKHCICSFYNLLGFMNLGIDAFHHFNLGEIFFKIFLFSLLQGPHLYLFWSFVFFIISDVSYSFFCILFQLFFSVFYSLYFL